jgi:hypothetical protein
MGIVLVAFRAASAEGAPLVYDDIDIKTHQFRRQCREAFGAAIGRSILNDEASTLVISQF